MCFGFGIPAFFRSSAQTCLQSPLLVSVQILHSLTDFPVNNIVRIHHKLLDNGKIVNLEFIASYWVVGFICERFHSH